MRAKQLHRGGHGLVVRQQRQSSQRAIAGMSMQELVQGLMMRTRTGTCMHANQPRQRA